MSTVRYYRWDDPGAPSLTGEVGSLTNLLRKCLVGVSGIAYGAKASAGWSEAFVGAASNIAVFRNNSADGGSGCYARVNDNAAGAGGAREAQICVYAAMTDINTGSSGTGSAWHRKSKTADAVARKWQVVADGRTAWVHSYDIGTAWGANQGYDTSFMGIGDYDCVEASSSLRYFCMARSVANSDAGTDIAAFESSAINQKSAAFTVVALNGISGVIQPIINLPLYGPTGTGGVGYPTAPHAITGDTYFMSNPVIRDGGNLLGRLRGIKLPYHNIMSNLDGATFPGYPGMVVARFRSSINVSTAHQVAALLDTEGPWL